MTQNNPNNQKKQKSQVKTLKPAFSFEKVMAATPERNTHISEKPKKIQNPNQNQNQNQNRHHQQAKNRQPGTAIIGKTGKTIKMLPLGGLGEVGKNITLYEYEGEMLLVDCGLSFPDSDMFGVDLVIPDFSFLVAHAQQIKGVIITHGHEDHIGALPYLLKQLNIPVYGAKLTIGFIKNKLEEHGLMSKTKLHEFKTRTKFKVGSFTIEPIHVNHSVPDAVSFAIETPTGIIIHTGDFKVDYTPINAAPIDLETFAAYGRRGVLAMMSDSTNAERSGYTESEQKVAEGFRVLFAKAENRRIFIATFSSNINRIQQIIELAAHCKRKVIFSGRSMEKNVEMALSLGYLKAERHNLVSMDEMRNFPPEKIVVVTTGSQGEPLSALSRMSAGSHRNVNVVPGDFIIISANPIPGNEIMVSRVINGLLRLGAEVIYEQMYDVHVSGHACAEELKLLISLVKPKFFLPLHGEYRQLVKHAKLAEAAFIPHKNIFIPEVGQTLCIGQNGITKGENVPVVDVLVDGLGVGDVGASVLRDRRLLSEDGLLVITATVDSVTNELLAGPMIETRGFVYVKGADAIMEEIENLVKIVFTEYEVSLTGNHEAICFKLKEQVQGLLSRRLKRKPMIIPLILEI